MGAVLEIHLNGEARQVTVGTTVAQLLAQLGLAGKPVAVEVNEQVVKQAQHGAHALAQGDRVEVVTFVGGG